MSTNALGRQFTVLHAFNAAEGEGVAHVRDHRGEVVHTVGYAVRPQLDTSGYEIPHSAEISGFERYAVGEHKRKGYGSAAQDAITRAHSGVPVVSYTEDMTPDAHAFRTAYMKRRPDVEWHVKEGTRW